MPTRSLELTETPNTQPLSPLGERLGEGGAGLSIGSFTKQRTVDPHGPLPARETGWRVAVVAAVAMLLVAAFVSPTSAAEDDEAARQMHQRIQELHQLLRQRQRERDQHEQRMQSLQAQVDRLERDHVEAQQRRTAAEQQVTEAEAAVAELTEARQRLSDQFTDAATAGQPVAEAMEQRIATGVPFRRDERAETAAAAAEAMASGDALEQAEGVAALLSFAGEEFRLTRETRFWNDPATLDDNRRVHAYQARLGLVQQILISEDGTQTGAAAHTAERAWQLDLTQAQRRQIMGAAAILRQQEPPRLIDVPLPAGTRPSESGGER